jgi:hypothetical protein
MSASATIPEYAQAIRKADQIYTRFYDPHDSAPKQIKLLVGTVKDVYDLLKESDGLIAGSHRPYPGQQNLNRRLEETDLFIRKYSSQYEMLSPDAATPYRPRQLLRIIGNTFDERKARKIHDGLMAEMHKLIQFIMVLAL